MRIPIHDRRIVSPMPWGSGAYVVHRYLERYIKEYRLIRYHPNWTLIPFALPVVAPLKRADLIHTTPDYAIFFHRKSHPMVLTFQNYVLDRWMMTYSSWVQKTHYTTDLRLLTRRALQKAHTLTAVSRFTARIVRQDLKITEPIRVIYNGVDVDLFRPRHSPPSASREIRIFFSGNLTQRKGAHWLPSISRRIDKNICIYYTQGLRRRESLASNANLRPVGAVSFENMTNRYRQMDMLLMPTVREGFSLAILEAMASGLPVVASDCSSIPEQIDDGKGGFLCPVGDVNAFAERINFLWIHRS